MQLKLKLELKFYLDLELKLEFELQWMKLVLNEWPSEGEGQTSAA